LWAQVRSPGFQPGVGEARRDLITITLLLLVLLSLSPVRADDTVPAEVRLPLKDYLALVASAERAEQQRAEESAHREVPVAEVVSQRVSAVVDGGEAATVSDFEVLVQGTALQPVLLPVAGLPETIEVRDAEGHTGTAAVAASDGGVLLTAPVPGRYTVHAVGRATLGTALSGAGATTGRLTLGRVSAAVASTEIDLPADLGWSSPGSVVVEEREQNGRRHVRLATARGGTTALDTKRKVDSAEAEKLLAQSVVLTILQLRPDGLRRHDVVLYEVRRGGLDRFTVELPPGLEIDQAATDEGTVEPVVETGHLTVHRNHRLQGVGYLVLTSPPASLPAGGLPLAAVRPEPEVRARYLAVSLAVAADVHPLPEASWTRVDTSDLPALLSEALASLDLAAAWRLDAKETGAQLSVAPLPPAPLRAAVVRRRDTIALLTVDGTLLFRDLFVIDAQSRAGKALDVTLPAGGKLWSTKVDGQAVRPLERNGAVSVPLGFDSGTRAEVEVVSVLERALPPGRSQLALDLPQVAAPVLVQHLRLLLPEDASYRFRRGDLRLAPAEPAAVYDALSHQSNVASNEPLYKKEAEGLQQGLVGGVKPLPVSIPESGKALVLSGVLPPQRVTVELDVKGKGKRS
jgi:hypothetical protein